MSTTTQHTQTNANEAQFLAPEDSQQAGPLLEIQQQEQQEGEIIMVPIKKLVSTPLNVRRTPKRKIKDDKDVVELAFLILSQGLLQNLVVVAEVDENGVPTGNYGAAAGERRRRALHLLVREGKYSEDKEIRCLLKSVSQALATSTAENSGREPMSPADTIIAFRDMVAAGATKESLSTCFGITVKTVERRLKLSTVAPALFELFRDEQMDMDQLAALAISDDQEAQKRVWKSLPDWDRDSDSIRRLLLGEQINAAHDAVARFVGIAAYEEAGGMLTRDLFQDDDTGYIADPELLHRLAGEKLQAEADKIKPEGWGWVETRLSLDYSARQAFTTSPMGMRDPTKKEKKQLDELHAAKDKDEAALEVLNESDDYDEDAADALDRQIGKHDEVIEKIDRKRRCWTPEVLALSGAIVTVDRSGNLEIHRGLVRASDKKQAMKAARPADEEGSDAGKVAPKQTHSEALVRKLTAHRNQALQVLLTDNTQVALAALAHTLIIQLIEKEFFVRSAVKVRAEGCDSHMTNVADDMEGSKAWTEMQSRLDNLRDRLPGDPAKLLVWLIAQPESVLTELLALCSALMVNTVNGTEGPGPGDQLAAAVGLDMADWWEPTAGSYLNQVPKALIAQAVGEAVCPDLMISHTQMGGNHLDNERDENETKSL